MTSIPRRWSSALCLLAGFTLVAGPAVAAPVWGGQVTQENGVPLIVNPQQAPQEEKVIDAVEQWRFGGEDEDDPILGLVTDVQVDDAGNAYLLDSNLSSIHVMSAGGDLLRTIGREGDGPGEFRSARRMALLPGGQVGVMEMMPGKIVVLADDGTPGPSLDLEGVSTGMRMFHRMAANGYGIVVGGMSTNLSNDGVTIRHALTRYDATGKLQKTLLKQEDVQSGGAIRIGRGDNEFSRYWTLCDDGRVVVYGANHDYRLEVYGREGDRERIITREYNSLRRTDESIAAERKQLEDIEARFAGGGGPEIDEYERDIDRVIARPDGELWVASSRGLRDCPSGALGVFDVLDAEGRLVRSLRISNADFDPLRDDYALRGNQLFVFKEAQMTSTSMSSGGGGAMMMISIGGRGGDDEDEDGEALPFEVICYSF